MREIEIALREYYETDDGRELTKILSNPSVLLEEGLLSRNSPLLFEAELILDSLNAYNNNIDNSEREYDLESISTKSPLYSWRSLVLAIKEFYNSNFDMMTSYINEIDPNSPLGPIYKGLLDKNNHKLYENNTDLDADLDSLFDVINNQMEDLYPETLDMVIKSIKEFNKQEFYNTILTIIEFSLDTISEKTITKTLLKHIEEKTLYRLMANANIFENPVKSIKYWILYINLMNFDSIEDNKLLGILSIIRDINKTLVKDKYKLSTNEKIEIEPHLKSLYQLLDRLFPRDIKLSNSSLTTLKRYLNLKVKQPKKAIVTQIDSLQGELF